MIALIAFRTVDFAAVLDRTARFLDAADQPWAIVGGVALAAYGLARTTLDLDFVVPAAVQEDLVSFMEAEGYATLHRSSGYSNHLHPDPERGRVDFVYVSGDTQTLLFEAKREVEGPGGRAVPVPKPEHLIAMKVQAMTDDRGRTFQELADIRHLLGVPGVDRSEVRRTFEQHGLAERYRDLEATL
jgi:hypothetical protein